MKEFERKRDLFLKELEDSKINNTFEKVDINEAVGFRAIQNMSNGICSIVVVLDNSAYNLVGYTFGKIENLDKKENILNLLNGLNQEYKILKFYVDDDNKIVAQFAYTSIADDFNAKLLLKIIATSLRNIEDNEYPKIMKIMWS